jgi:hypothetical protein
MCDVYVTLTSFLRSEGLVYYIRILRGILYWENDRYTLHCVKFCRRNSRLIIHIGAYDDSYRCSLINIHLIARDRPPRVVPIYGPLHMSTTTP